MSAAAAPGRRRRPPAPTPYPAGSLLPGQYRPVPVADRPAVRPGWARWGNWWSGRWFRSVASSVPVVLGWGSPGVVLLGASVPLLRLHRGAGRDRDLRPHAEPAALAGAGGQRPAEHLSAFAHPQHTVPGAVGGGGGTTSVVVHLQHQAR